MHTPEALSEELRQLQEAHPRVLLAGSLGRAVLFGAFYGDPEREFSARLQPPTGISNRARDIDILGICPSPEVRMLAPFEVDAEGFANPYVHFVLEGDTWYLTSDRHGFEEELPPDVMQIIEGQTVYGIYARTLPPQTHLALYGLKGMLRRKDGVTMPLLQGLCEGLPKKERLPNCLYAPFEALRAINRRDPVMIMQGVYRRHVPECIRAAASPLAKVVKKALT